MLRQPCFACFTTSFASVGRVPGTVERGAECRRHVFRRGVDADGARALVEQPRRALVVDVTEVAHRHRLRGSRATTYGVGSKPNCCRSVWRGISAGRGSRRSSSLDPMRSSETTGSRHRSRRRPRSSRRRRAAPSVATGCADEQRSPDEVHVPEREDRVAAVETQQRPVAGRRHRRAVDAVGRSRRPRDELDGLPRDRRSLRRR